MSKFKHVKLDVKVDLKEIVNIANDHITYEELAFEYGILIMRAFNSNFCPDCVNSILHATHVGLGMHLARKNAK